MPLRPATEGEGALRDAIKSNLIARFPQIECPASKGSSISKRPLPAHIEAYGKLRHMAPTRLCYLSSQQRGQSVLQRLPDKASLPIPQSHRGCHSLRRRVVSIRGLRPHIRKRRGGAWIFVEPVEAGSSQELRAAMIDARGHAKAVQLYLMQPLRPGRSLLDRLAELRRYPARQRRDWVRRPRGPLGLRALRPNV